MVMFNSSKPHSTSGFKDKDEILSFISDVLNPPVITLDYSQWILKINNKREDEVSEEAGVFSNLFGNRQWAAYVQLCD